ncbi:MAG: AraC family transcriptional regulator [Bacteroidota bacterium]
MKQYDFIKNKYGKELLVDLGRIESLEGYVLSQEKHVITFYEVLVISEGAGVYSLDNEQVPYQEGTVIVTLPNQIRTWNLHQPTKGFSFFFEGEFLNTFFRDDVFLNRFAIFDYNRPAIHTTLDTTNFEKCLWIFEEVETEFHLLQGDSSHMLRSLLYYSISLIDRAFREQHQLTPLDIHPAIYRFRRLLNQHILEWRTVGEYATALRLSHNQLNKLCKKHLLQTALQIIHERLMIEAKREVLFSDKTISEISALLNFSDVANFNRFFKKMTGQTANQFRQTA